jgi:hypothetical protein
MLPKRFWDKVEKTDGCWIWVGSVQKSGQYAVYWHNGKLQYAHRVSYESLVGPIPDGLQIDHLCRVRFCVNPAHLEPVTQQVNMARGTAGAVIAQIQRSKTECAQGHPYSPENTYHRLTGGRSCKACAKQRAIAARKLRKAQTQ